MRFALLALLLAAPAAFAAGPPAADPPAADPPADRPNLLFAFADDWGRYASAYAALDGDARNDLSRAAGFSTPNFDRVAARGVLFTRAYVNAPSCTPCRSSLLTGRPFYTTGRGAILNGAVWDGSITSYPEALEGGGYTIGQTYKVWSPGTPVDAPFGGKRTGYEQAGSKFNAYSKRVTQAGGSVKVKNDLYNEVQANFTAFLEDANGADKPWHYWFGPTNVHRTWARGSGQAIWDIDPDSLEGKLPPFLPDVPTVREDFADYLGEVMAFDAALGVLLDELEHRGELDNTVIAVSGDHGAPGFPRGKCNLYDFGTAVPLAIAGPGVAAGPAGGGRVVDDFVTLPDLAPTFLDLAGVERPEGMTAASLVPVLESESGGHVDPGRTAAFFGRERHVGAARTGYLPYPQRGIRTDEYLYIRNFAPDRWPMGTAPGYGEPGEMPGAEKLDENTRAAFADLDASPTKTWMIQRRDEPGVADLFALGFLKRPAEELFHLPSDPHQVENVADDPAHAAAKRELSERLLAHLKEHGDPRVTGDGTTFDEPPYAGRDRFERRPGGGVKKVDGR